MRSGGAWSTLVTVLLWVESAIVLVVVVSVLRRLDGGDVGADVTCPAAVLIVLAALMAFRAVVGSLSGINAVRVEVTETRPRRANAC